MARRPLDTVGVASDAVCLRLFLIRTYARPPARTLATVLSTDLLAFR
jgi:hypothetical protein